MPLIIGVIVTMVFLARVAPEFTMRNIEVISKILAFPMLAGILWSISQLFSNIENKILSSITKTKWRKIGETDTEIIYEDAANTDDRNFNHSNGYKWVRK
jgi:hypothetical protein